MIEFIFGFVCRAHLGLFVSAHYSVLDISREIKSHLGLFALDYLAHCTLISSHLGLSLQSSAKCTYAVISVRQGGHSLYLS